MRVVVCNRLTEYLGVEILSALLKARGHSVELVFEPDLLTAAFVRSLPGGLKKRVDSAARAARRVLALGPDLVLFPSEINSFEWCARVGEAVHEADPSIHLLHGGFHATSASEECIAHPGATMLCIGEGDEAVPELVDALAAGADHRTIANIWVKDRDGTVHRNKPRPLIGDLDALPYPDKGLYYDAIPGLSREYMCVASRGCHWACSFCFYTTLYDMYGREGFLRARSPQHVIGELEHAIATWDVQTIVFHDDIFPTTLKWLREFAPLYKEKIGLPFSCITHPQLVRQETADLLGDMGCKYVIMGAQTVNEASRSPEVINRTESSEEIAAAIKRLRAHGIFVLVDHIFGIPGEKASDQDEALAFYADAGPDVVKPFFMSYFPGTDLTKRSELEQGDGEWDHFMFEGALSGDDYRAWNLAYAVWPLLGPRGRRLLRDSRIHHRLAPLGGLPGLGNVILFPRLITGLLNDRDIRPRLYLNYLRSILKYQAKNQLFP